MELVQPYLLKVAIDDYMLRADWAGLDLVGGLFVAAPWSSSSPCAPIEGYLMSVTGQRVMHDLREALFRHLLTMEARFFDRHAVGRLMTRVLNDVDAVSEAFSSGLFAVVADVVTLVGVVAVLLWMDWRLALVTFAIVPVVTVVAAYFRLRARDAYRDGAPAPGPAQRLPPGVARGHGGDPALRPRAPGAPAVPGAEPPLSPRALRLDRVRARRSTPSVEALGFVALALLLWYGGGQDRGGGARPSARWSRSCSTPVASSCPSATSARSTP